MAFPVRASKGPAKRIEARIFLLSSGGISFRDISEAFISQAFSESFSTFAPNDCKIKSITPVSSISGIFRKITFSEVSKEAAMQGRAAFLFPLAFIVPFIGKPPSILYSYIAQL